MKTVQPKSNEEKLEIEFVVKRCDKAKSTKEMDLNSTMSATIVPEVWIMSGLLLSAVMQIAFVSHLLKQGAPPEDN